MTRLNFVVILIAVILYALCSNITLRDRLLIYSLHRIEKRALYEPSSRLLFEGAMSGMVGQLYHPLGDHYSDYIPFSDQKKYEESLDNHFEGIGITYRQVPVTKETEILYPMLNSPAFDAGIRSGDKILSVNGKETKGLVFYEVYEMFQGKLNEKIELSLLPFDKTEPICLFVPRASVLQESVEGERIEIQSDKKGKRIFTLPDHAEIAYLRITAFSERTANEVQTALEQISKTPAKSLILDLRGNPGGYVSICTKIAGFFLQPKPDQDVIVSTRLRNGKTKNIYRLDAATLPIWKLPMVVLIDGGSASASEILSAALQDYGRATIVGTRSFGKGVVQEIVPLPMNSGTLQLTDAGYWRPSNRNIHRGTDAKESDVWGVMPDIAEPISDEQHSATFQIRERRSNIVAEDRDAVLADFIRRLPKEIEAEQKNEHSETKNKDNKPFVLKGNPPYYDPQLDKAIEILNK